MARDDVLLPELAERRHVRLAAGRLHIRAPRVGRQAGGRFAGLGMSPESRIVSRSDSTAGSGIGTAESSEIVYGWSGLS